MGCLLDCLEDKGLAVGTESGHVDLFNTSALELHGPTDPYKSMDASELAIHTLIDLVTDGICVGFL